MSAEMPFRASVLLAVCKKDKSSKDKICEIYDKNFGANQQQFLYCMLDSSLTA